MARNVRGSANFPRGQGVVFIGNTGKDFERGETHAGKTYARGSLAVYAGKDESGNRLTDWYNVVAYEGTADILLNHVHKGDQVALTVGGIEASLDADHPDPKMFMTLRVTGVQLLKNARSESSDSYGGNYGGGSQNEAEIPF